MKIENAYQRFMLFFAISLTIALSFTYLILPQLSSMLSEHGVMLGDATHYHLQAINYVNQMKDSASFSPKIWSSISVTGNVFLLSYLYKWFGVGSKAYIFLNILLHVLSATILFRIVEICSKHKEYQNKLAYGLSFLFLLSPSHLIWTTQPLKDSFYILGWFLITLSFIQVSKTNDFIAKPSIIALLTYLAGTLFIIFVRPQYAIFLLIISTLFIFSCIILNRKNYRLIGLAFCFLLMSLVTYNKVPKLGEDSDEKRAAWESQIMNRDRTWEWKESSYLPRFVDQKFKALALIRMRLLIYSKTSNTSFETDFRPQRASELILKLPILLFKALVGPFPNLMNYNISLPKKASLFIEAIPQWIFFLGFIINLFYVRKINHQNLTILLITIPILGILSLVNMNWGTLLRSRYPFIHLINIFSLNGLIFLFRRFQPQQKEIIT